MRWKFPKPYSSKVQPANPETEPEITQSNRIIKSATPKYTLDWYVKWVASIIVIIAISFRSSGVEALHVWDLLGSFIGASMWWWVAFIWQDRALMLVNGLASIVLFAGILQYYFGI